MTNDIEIITLAIIRHNISIFSLRKISDTRGKFLLDMRTNLIKIQDDLTNLGYNYNKKGMILYVRANVLSEPSSSNNYCSQKKCGKETRYCIRIHIGYR